MTARVHDYRQRYWGHDYTLTPNPDPITARIIGWGYNLQAGDLLIIPRKEGGAALYRIEELRYTPDPPDMWFTTCRFVPGSSVLADRAALAMTRPMVGAFTEQLAGWWEL